MATQRFFIFTPTWGDDPIWLIKRKSWPWKDLIPCRVSLNIGAHFAPHFAAAKWCQPHLLNSRRRIRWMEHSHGWEVASFFEKSVFWSTHFAKIDLGKVRRSFHSTVKRGLDLQSSTFNDEVWEVWKSPVCCWNFRSVCGNLTTFRRHSNKGMMTLRAFPKKLLFVGIWDHLNLMESLRFSHSKRLGPVSGRFSTISHWKLHARIFPWFFEPWESEGTKPQCPSLCRSQYGLIKRLWTPIIP